MATDHQHHRPHPSSSHSPPSSVAHLSAITSTSSVHGGHLSPPSPKHSSTASITPAIAAAEAMASFVAQRPRTASRVNAFAASHDAGVPVAESSTAAVLREKLAQLSLQQQHYHREEHSRPQSIGIVRAGKQRDDGTSHEASLASSPSSRSPPRRLASSTKSHDSAVPHKPAQASLYKLSRGRSDHVSPSRVWDRRGASATVLSGASGSGSGGEDSEITLRPRRGRRAPAPAAQQQIATIQRASPYHTNLNSTDASPTLLTTAATTPSPSLSRKSSFRRHNSALARWVDNKPPSVAFDSDHHVREEDAGDAIDAEDTNGHITSSDEEGADASRFARRRRVSLERDRRRGMRILLATSGDNSSFHVSANGSTGHCGSSSRRGRRTSSERKRGCFETEGDLRLTPTSEAGSTFPSMSATPTTNGDDHSERSSLLSRSSSSDAAEFAATTLSGLTPCAAGRRRRMHSAGENAEASIFGLADDEHDHDLQYAATLAVHAEDVDPGHDADADDSLSGQDAMPTSGALSSCALAAALTRRNSRSKSSGRRIGGAKYDKTRSTPASRRPSHPETSIPGGSSSSVPHRPSAILGFAPVTSCTGTSSPYSTLPRRRVATALLPSRTAWLPLSPKGAAAGHGDQSSLLDLLSGTSIDSVEDLILVDQVEWASDKDEPSAANGKDAAVQARKADAIDSRRSSMISVRQGDIDRVECTGQPTVAALEAGSLLNATNGQDDGVDSATGQSAATAIADATGLPPPSPTGTGGAIFSTQDPIQHPGNDRQGFAAVYQDRISNLQSQLRLWSRDREHRTKSPSPDRHSITTTDGQGNDNDGDAALHASHASSGLFASSWKQIARLPNLFFHTGSAPGNNSGNTDGPQPGASLGNNLNGDLSMSRKDSAVGSTSSGAATPLTRSSSREADISSLADNLGGALSPSSSPDSSGLVLRATSGNEMSPAPSRDSRAARHSHGRSPSLGARGVISPQDGDVDPGAYVTGLGHRIDPDVELASVVHLHTSRAHRGRSVDTSRRPHSQAPRHHHHVPTALSQAPVHRAAASDSERSPLLSAKGDVESLLSKANANGLESKALSSTGVVPPLELPPAVAPSEQSASSAEISTDTDLKVAPSSNGSSRRTRSRARFTLHGSREEDDEDEDERRTEGAADSQSHAKATSATVATSGNRSKETTDEEGFTMVRNHRARGRPDVSRPAAEAPVPVNYSAYGDTSSSTSDDEAGQTVRARRSRSRARSSKDDVRGSIAMTPSASESSNSADGYTAHRDDDENGEEEDQQGPVRGRRGRGRGRGSRNNSPPATARSRQCAIGLFSASNKACRRDGATGTGGTADPSKNIAAATRSGLGVRSVRSSPNLTYAKVAATRVGQSDGKDDDGSGCRERRGRGAGRGTDDDEEESSEDDRSRRGRERGVVKVTSSSFKESECPPNSLPRSASAGDFRSLSFSPSSPQAAASQSQAMQLRKQRLLASQSAANGVSGGVEQGGVSSGGESLLAPSGSMPGGSQCGNGSGSANSTSGSLMAMPNRPTLLSNSAHLLMLSLELEMMRAQKISAPLRIRWARQRTISASVMMNDGDLSAAPCATATTETDPDVCATSGSDATATALPPALPATIDTTRDPAKGNPLYSSLTNARQLYGQTYRPRQGSQLRNVVNA